MKKVYSFAKQATVAVAICFGSFFSTQAFGQRGNIVENFNNTGGGTAGFNGDFSLGTQSGNGFLRKINVIARTIYTINTPTYQLLPADNAIGFGFELSGPSTVATATISIFYISSITGTLQQVSIATIVPAYSGSGSNTQATICQTVSTSSLPGFPAGGRYSFRIELTPNQGNGGSNDVIIFDNFRTNGGPAQIPLPVSFISFDASKTASGVQLSWKTAEQDNVSHYEVERSNDGRSFTSIASVAISKSNSYSYLDISAVASAYYRIKNVDNDGKFKYSNIARIANGLSSIVMNAFPQPALSKLTVQHPTINGNALFTLSAADGRIINTIRPVTGSMQTMVDVSKLQSGLYLLRFNDGAGNVETMKVIKQ